MKASARRNKKTPGGCDPKAGVFHREMNEHIAQAFENVDLNLKNGGGDGWEQVRAGRTCTTVNQQ
ncbi:L-PSP endoribonuclease family protein [Penicillium canariense]|uniref:L-PSP endoribonuclease family protein n=1 Tax=Penicillium canariense TaxID=189055 RepID=A0A9W9LU15_9EURO|nr:L-PSP endoribonuclease family protein [Penicillium canariense]KAJ5176586.1 L-PSP endoribonuclease family protein [Penicillium canariense]